MDKLLWIDMEMTGLDVEKEVIIEAAAVVTDLDLSPIEQYHAIVKQPQHYLDNMDEWNRTHHGASGLTAQVPNGTPPTQVEQDLLQLIFRHFPQSEKPILAGNSIGQDRLFINKYWPQLAARLHYRMLDVTSWKIMMNAKYKVIHKKRDVHRAVDDILESIAELKTYLSYIKKQ